MIVTFLPQLFLQVRDVVGGGGGGGVGGEHCCTLSGQQSLYLVQVESHQQPEGAFPPQLPRQVLDGWPPQL